MYGCVACGIVNTWDTRPPASKPPEDDLDECETPPPDPTACPRCGGPGRQVREADIEPPTQPPDGLAESTELPLHLGEIWWAYSMLERDEVGAARILTAGAVLLDELGIRGRDERLRWIGLWAAANGGFAEVAEAARQA